MTDDDRIPASFVWTGDDGPDDQQRVPEGPALGTYPSDWGAHPETHYRLIKRGEPWPGRRSTVGEKLARLLNDLAEKVRGIH